MFRSFNFWYVFAPLGAIVAAYVGYNRSHRNGKHRVKLDLHTAWLDIAVSAVASTILCALFFIESHRGLVELFVGDGTDGLGALFGAVCAIIAPPIVSALYGWGLWKLAQYCAKIGVCSFYCRATPRRDRYGEIKYIIDATDLAIAIAAATAKDRRTRRFWQATFRHAQRQTKGTQNQAKTKSTPTQTRSRKERTTSSNLNRPQDYSAQTDTRFESTPTAQSSLPTTRPAPSEKLVTTTLHGPDGSSREIEVPENRVADLQMAMLRYCNSMAKAQSMIRSALQETEAIKRERARLELRAEFEETVKQLDPVDRKLIRQALKQYPWLGGIIESDNLHIRIRFVGTGSKHQVRFYSMRFSAAS